MSTNPTRLQPEDRDFLSIVSEAAFANPFSHSRKQLDAKISGMPAATPDKKTLQAALERLRGFLDRLDRSGRTTLRAFHAEDHALLTTAYLFDIFHRYMDRLDAFIRFQLDAPDSTCEAIFASELMRDLANRGFSQTETSRYLALFYQLRRAYYFIACALVGQAPCMQELRLRLWENVFTHDTHVYVQYMWNRMEDFSTLLLGETGTGKGAAATAIGRSGFIPFDARHDRFKENFTQTFIAINLSQYAENLIESELFGHRKGAFTGAMEAHEGVFSRCSPCGSIFLDEIGDVSIPIQIKLLKVLQERTFSPVGSHENLRFHGRVIAACNRSIEDLRNKGLFRDDFYYRLSSDIIVVPPLRQRLAEDPGELDLLIGVILQRILGSVGTDYPWPGNVRELEQCVRRVILTHRYAGDTAAIASDLRGRIAAGIDAGAYDARDLQADYCLLLYERAGTYEEVARRTGLDRRTVKKYVTR